MAIGYKERIKDGSKSLPTRYFSSKQEKAVAKATGGRQTPNSGATTWVKSDVLTEDFAIECKTKATHSESISIKKEWFEKQKQEMVFMGKKHSAIVFNFGPGEENHYIIDEYLFKALQEYLESLEETL